MRPDIQVIVDGLIDDMLDGPVPCDLVQTLALPTPSLIICRLLGVPHEDRDFFQRNASTLIDRNSSVVEAMTARQTLTEYLDRLITIKQTRPGDDLMTQLSRHIEDGQISQEAATATASLLLIAGHETTANLIALGTAVLLQDPEQLAALQQDKVDTDLVSPAVDELLRYLTSLITVCAESRSPIFRSAMSL